MNRYTFRGKSGIEGDDKWYYGSIIQNENGMVALREEKAGDISYTPIVESSLGQFFFENKSGAIFEGDIVKDNDKCTYFVYWSVNNSCFYLELIKGSPTKELTDLSSLKVVDNLFDREQKEAITKE